MSSRLFMCIIIYDSKTAIKSCDSLSKRQVKLTDLRRSIEARDEVRCNLLLEDCSRRAKIAQFEHSTRLVNLIKWRWLNRSTLRTRILSGLMSAWTILHFLRRRRARSSCRVYLRTAFRCRPTLLPYFLSSSRRFILKGSSILRVLLILFKRFWRDSEV